MQVQTLGKGARVHIKHLASDASRVISCTAAGVTVSVDMIDAKHEMRITITKSELLEALAELTRVEEFRKNSLV